MKNLFNYLKLVVKRDFIQLKADWKLRRETRLIRSALKYAYKLHMSNNLRYYVIRMSLKQAILFPLPLISGRLSKKESACVVLTSRQVQLFVTKGLISKAFWKRRHELTDVYVMDGYFNQRMKASFKRVERYRSK